MTQDYFNRLSQIADAMKITLQQLEAEVAACKKLRESAEALLLKAQQFSQQNEK